MPKVRRVRSEGDVAIQLQVIRTLEKVLLDPIWSSMFGFLFASKWGENPFTRFSAPEKLALRIGVIDINRSRAEVKGTAILDVLEQAVRLTEGLAKGLGVKEMGAAAVGAKVAGPAGAIAGMTIQQLIESGQAKFKSPGGE